MITHIEVDLGDIDKVANGFELLMVASWADLRNEITDPAAHPIDTTFAAASWWLMVGGQPEVNPDQPQKVKSGQSVPMPVFDPTPMIGKLGLEFALVNNAEYINRLEFDGHSPQAPNGWVRTKAAMWSSIVEKNVGLFFS